MCKVSLGSVQGGILAEGGVLAGQACHDLLCLPRHQAPAPPACTHVVRVLALLRLCAGPTVPQRHSCLDDLSASTGVGHRHR